VSHVTAANKFHIALGLLTAAIGTMPLLALMGILPTRPPAPGDAPAWLGLAFGLAFFLAGIIVIVRSFAGADDSSSELPSAAPRGLRVFYDLLVMPIPVLLALIFSWVAFGPGERHFSTSVGFGGMGIATSGGGDMMGRVVFGFAAVLAWLFVGFGMLTLARRWLPRR
jgi:hypothetical protein